jgi:uncharacterized protein YjgD (DUF1641 family)
MKDQYDPLIKAKITKLLTNEQTIEDINNNIDEILKIYNCMDSRGYGHLSYNNPDEAIKTRYYHEYFFDNFKDIVRYVYKTIYAGDVIDENFVEKITAKLFSSSGNCSENLRSVFISLLQIDPNDIKEYIERFADNIDFQENDMVSEKAINGATKITFKLSDNLTNFNHTFAWDFFTREKAHGCVVNKWLRTYQKSSDLECLKNYLTIIYRVFYSFQFFNNVEDDEYNDAKNDK